MKHLFIAIFLMSFFQPLFADENIDNLQKLEAINSQIEKNKKIIQPKKERKKLAEKNLGLLKKELRINEIKLKKAKKKLHTVQQKETLTKQQINTLETKFKRQQASFSKRVVSIYKTEQLDLIEFLFSSKDLIDVTDASFYFDQIIKGDIQLINAIKTEYQVLEDEREKLKDQTKNIKKIKKDIATKESSLERKKIKQKAFIKKLKNQITAIEAQNKELAASSKEITKFILKAGKGKNEYYGTGSYIKPVKGWISSKFGYRKHPIFKRRIKHNGIDIAAPKGYKIKASDSGVVLVAGEKARYKGYGKIVVIDHGRRKDGRLVSTFYAHQSRILVKKGDFVTKGDEIGWVGSSGYATGPHLHFEVRVDGVPKDPLKFLP